MGIRLGKKNGGNYHVVKTHDELPPIIVAPGLNGAVAQLIAGAYRDEMSDAEVGEGWNYIACTAAALKASIAEAKEAREQ